MSVYTTIRIQDADFDTAAEIAALSAGRTDIGAIVSFSGICRGTTDGDDTAALTLEHYPGMAEAEIGRHAEEAISRWPLTGLTIIHRVGRILPGENIVLVVTASAHRQAAFHAAEFLMDYLKANAPFWKHEETADGKQWVTAQDRDDEGRYAMEQDVARAVTKKPAVKPGQALPVKPGELVTLFDFVRYAVSRFKEADVVFAHGTTDPIAEAAFIVGEVLHLHPDQFEMFAQARVTQAEAKTILAVIDARIRTRKPAAYLLNKIYMRGLPFYVDERTIVPRSFIGELLDTHLRGDDGSLIDDPDGVESVLDLCTGSGCLAILAAHHFAHARIDAVDLSGEALKVAARNVGDYGLDDRITLYKGDLFTPLGGTRYDLIISNPPYVDADGMAGLPRECRHEPAMAFDGGDDGLDIVRRIMAEAASHLTPDGGLLCEIGRCRPAMDAAFPDLPLLWLDTEDSEGEVFWIGAGDLRSH